MKMIKFPKTPRRESDGTECSLKAAVDTGMVALGQRYMIEGNPITCVDIDDDKYIFSMDEIFTCAAHKEIPSILRQIYETGKIGNKEVLPISMMKDIDFLFVPSEFQVFGKNVYGAEEESIKQFEWYKRGDFVRVKGYHGKDSFYWKASKVCYWWLSTVASSGSTRGCLVDDDGTAQCSSSSDPFIGVPVFFQITLGR